MLGRLSYSSNQERILGETLSTKKRSGEEEILGFTPIPNPTLFNLVLYLVLLLLSRISGRPVCRPRWDTLGEPPKLVASLSIIRLALRSRLAFLLSYVVPCTKCARVQGTTYIYRHARTASIT